MISQLMILSINRAKTETGSFFQGDVLSRQPRVCYSDDPGRAEGERAMLEDIKMVLAIGAPIALGIYLISLLRNEPLRKKRKAK